MTWLEPMHRNAALKENEIDKTEKYDVIRTNKYNTIKTALILSWPIGPPPHLLNAVWVKISSAN